MIAQETYHFYIQPCGSFYQLLIEERKNNIKIDDEYLISDQHGISKEIRSYISTHENKMYFKFVSCTAETFGFNICSKCNQFFNICKINNKCTDVLVALIDVPITTGTIEISFETRAATDTSFEMTIE
jgi:hypothetical protein